MAACQPLGLNETNSSYLQGRSFCHRLAPPFWMWPAFIAGSLFHTYSFSQIPFFSFLSFSSTSCYENTSLLKLEKCSVLLACPLNAFCCSQHFSSADRTQSGWQAQFYCISRHGLTVTHCHIFLLISNCAFLLLLVLHDLLYHYLDYCGRIKFFIARENRWPLNFLPYHMFLDTTSVKNLSQTLNFWVSATVFTSVFTSLCSPGIRLGLAMHSYFYKKLNFCSIWIFCWVVV